MAKRLVFFPTYPNSLELFREELVDFEWVPGLAISQGRKSVVNLHNAAKEDLGIENILEISTRSDATLGLQLSAFNLEKLIGDKKYSVESIYQSSKVFEFGGPFADLIIKSSMDSKTDPRLKNSGKLLHHEFNDQIWPLSTSPNVYDLIYISAILEFNLRQKILAFEAFTDIAYNQIALKNKSGKSFNCQARSAAIYVSLTKRVPENEIITILENYARSEKTAHEQIDLFD
jgi:hypothetical protein